MCHKTFPRSIGGVNKGISLEYMHCALLRVTKLLLNMWTDGTRSRNTIHGIHTDIARLDERISHICVPSEIQRKPRGISDIKHWKGICDSTYRTVYQNCVISMR